MCQAYRIALRGCSEASWAEPNLFLEGKRKAWSCCVERYSACLKEPTGLVLRSKGAPADERVEFGVSFGAPWGKLDAVRVVMSQSYDGMPGSSSLKT